MKIAIPTREDVVDDHFGHCDHYTVFTIDEDKNINHDCSEHEETPVFVIPNL